MKRSIVFAMLLAGGVLCLAGPVSAQFYPGYGYGGWGGYDGGAALLGSDQRQAAIIQARAESRIAGQQAAQQQNSVVQSGIRNTLTNQANSREASIANQQEQTQDWWFQHQQQQFSQQQMARGSAEYSTSSVPSMGWSSLGPPHKPPPAAMDIIQWPTLLQDPCFAAERTKIEAPYRKGAVYIPGAPPKLGNPNEEDYRQMAAAVEDMKAVLQWKLGEGVDTGQYNTAKAFLSRLGGELTKMIR